MNEIKRQICDRIEGLRQPLLTLSHNIAANPELGYNEYKAVEFIRETVTAQGWEFTSGTAGIDTAFIASKSNGEGPHIAILAEYDALAEVGHACGHNVIATMSTGAFLGLAPLMDHFQGKVSLIGCPAEEGGAGKVRLVAAGVFDDVDYAMMIHPSSGHNVSQRGGRAANRATVRMKGKAAHSSNPASGINALNAIIATFNHLDMLRPTFNQYDNVNGIITKGGASANTIPDDCEAFFSLRAKTMIEMKVLQDKIRRAAEAAAALTGATAEVTFGLITGERYCNPAMCEAFRENLKEFGEEMTVMPQWGNYGSSDIGNVGVRLPIIHEYIWIAPKGTVSHNKEYTDWVTRERADDVCVMGAQTLAMTAADIFMNPDLRAKIKADFDALVPTCYQSDEWKQL